MRANAIASPRVAAARCGDAQAEPADCEACALVSRAVLGSEAAKRHNVEFVAHLHEYKAELAALPGSTGSR